MRAFCRPAQVSSSRPAIFLNRVTAVVLVAGMVCAVGCSTHTYAGPVMPVVLGCGEIEVIFATANKEGRMLEGGSHEQQLADLRRAHEIGKGVSVMKLLAGGQSPESEVEAWVRWGFELDSADALVLGIRDRSQLDLDVRIACDYEERGRVRQKDVAF